MPKSLRLRSFEQARPAARLDRYAVLVECACSSCRVRGLRASDEDRDVPVRQASRVQPLDRLRYPDALLGFGGRCPANDLRLLPGSRMARISLSSRPGIE